jgi:hypothetical protein
MNQTPELVHIHVYELSVVWRNQASLRPHRYSSSIYLREQRQVIRYAAMVAAVMFGRPERRLKYRKSHTN